MLLRLRGGGVAEKSGGEGGAHARQQSMKHDRETSAPLGGASTGTATKARSATLGNPRRTQSSATASSAAGVAEHDQSGAFAAEWSGATARPRRLTLSSLIARDLQQMGAREQRRRQMLTMLLLAHMLLVVAIAIGYLLPSPTPIALVVTGGALLLYLAVGAVNLALRRLDLAIYFLVFGNAALVTFVVGALAVAGQPFTVAQIALLYLAVVCEAGLLFTPEIVLILSGVTATLSAIALLFAISVAPPPSSSQTYLLVVFTLTLQALVGLLAWYVADFIAETIQESRRASQHEYAQIRLDALQGQAQRQQHELDLIVVAIQTAIARTLAQEPNARVEGESGRWGDLVRSINLLLQRLDEANRAAQEQARMLAATRTVVDAVGRLTEPGAGSGTTGPRTPLTYTPIDNISIAVSQVQQHYQARQGHIQRLTADATHIAGHSRDELKVALDATSEAQAAVGRLLRSVEEVMLTVRRNYDLSARGRHALLGHVAPDVIAAEPAPPRTTLDVAEAVELSGLNADIFRPGETGEFELVPDQDPDAAGIGKITRMMPALDSTASALSPQEAMNEVWRLLTELDSFTSNDERAANSMTHQLGLLNGEMRRAATKLAWVLQALETLRRNAEQIEHVSSTPDPLADPTTHPALTQEAGARPPIRTRPLADEQPGALPEESPEVPGEGAAPGTLSAADLLGPLDDAVPPLETDGTGNE